MGVLYLKREMKLFWFWFWFVYTCDIEEERKQKRSQKSRVLFSDFFSRIVFFFLNIVDQNFYLFFNVKSEFLFFYLNNANVE